MTTAPCTRSIGLLGILHIIILLSGNYNIAYGFVQKLPTTSFATQGLNSQQQNSRCSSRVPRNTPQRAGNIVRKAHDDSKNENDSKTVAAAGDTLPKQLFSFLSSVLDVVGIVSTVVIGVGAGMGFLLNLSGYGYTLPTKDRMYVKVEKLETMRENYRFNRMAAGDIIKKDLPKR